jgi:RND family efflux transporter MFP subunit
MHTTTTSPNPFDMLKSRKYLVGGVAMLVLLMAFEWTHIRHMTGTPMAPPIVREASARIIRAEGRLVTYPGAQAVVGTDVGGRLRSLPVTEKARVKKGDLIAEIDADEQKAALAEARRRVTEAEVDMKYFETEVVRSESLLGVKAIATASADRTTHDRDGARARRDVALATAQRLATVVAKTRIVSPIDGTVIGRLHDPGETLAPGAELVTVADLDRTRVEAEVDEYDAGRIAVGSAVTLRAEGHAEASWKGKVEEVPDAVTPRRLKPQDPARPSDTRVLLVKVALDGPIPVKLGQRVEVEIETGKAAGP